MKKFIRSNALPTNYKAKCYRNLNKPGVTWSVINSTTGLVDQYANTVILKNVQFKVSKSGQARVRKEKRKNVHAFVMGDIIAELPENTNIFHATYNPYKDDGFHLKDGGSTLTHARFAVLCERGLFVVL
jgi:hypothetical protein